MHLWDEMVVASRSRSIHHHLVELLARVLAFEHNRLMLQVFGVLTLL